MNELIAAANVAMIVRREVDEDYVGLWVIPWHVRRSVVRASDDRVREISVAALTALLQDGVLIGDLDGNTSAAAARMVAQGWGPMPDLVEVTLDGVDA